MNFKIFSYLVQNSCLTAIFYLKCLIIHWIEKKNTFSYIIDGVFLREYDVENDSNNDSSSVNYINLTNTYNIWVWNLKDKKC